MRDLTTSDEFILKCAAQLSYSNGAVAEACHLDRANPQKYQKYYERVMKVWTTRTKMEQEHFNTRVAAPCPR